MARSQAEPQHDWGQERTFALQKSRPEQQAFAVDAFALLNGSSDADNFAKEILKPKDDHNSEAAQNVQPSHAHASAVNAFAPFDEDGGVEQTEAEPHTCIRGDELTTNEESNKSAPDANATMADATQSFNKAGDVKTDDALMVDFDDDGGIDQQAGPRSHIDATEADPNSRRINPCTTFEIAVGLFPYPLVRSLLPDTATVMSCVTLMAPIVGVLSCDAPSRLRPFSRGLRHDPYSGAHLFQRPPPPGRGSRRQAFGMGLDVWQLSGLPPNLPPNCVEDLLQRLFVATDLFAGRWPTMFWGDEPGSRYNNKTKRQQAGGKARGRLSAHGKCEMAFFDPLPKVTREVPLPNVWWLDACGVERGGHVDTVAPVLRLHPIKPRGPGHRDGIG